MKKKNNASVVASSQSKKKSDFILQQNSVVREKKLNRYPTSNGTVKLSSPCPYCGHHTGLIIIRFKEDSGFVRCGRCDAALYSLNEHSHLPDGLTHAGTVLDNYLPTLAGFSGVAR